MAALAAGNTVVAAAVLVPLSLVEAMPLYGVVESLGSPTANVVVDWENGTRVSYVASQTAGGTPLIVQAALTTVDLILGSVVDPVAGIPNPGGRLRGVVVSQFDALAPDGADRGDVVIVQTKDGFYLAPAAYVAVVPAS